MKILKAISLIAILTGLTITGLAAPLEDQLAAFRKDSTGANEQKVLKLLRLGESQKRQVETYAALRSWLQANALNDPSAIHLAATSAEQAGEWADAVSFYRKLLTGERVNKSLADKAVPAFYRMMIIGMGDSQAAYQFMRKHGGPLRAYGNARQFDPWFLGRAISGRDLAAAAERFAHIHNDMAADPKVHDAQLKQFMAHVEGYSHSGDELFAALKKFAAAKKTPAHIKARLLWVAEILPLNKKVDELFSARKEVPASAYTRAAKAAEEVVRLQPYEGSMLVARGWCNFHDGHTPNVEKKAGYHRKLKSVPILKAMAKLSPAQIRSIMSARAPRERPVTYIFEASEMKRLVMSRPEVFNSLGAPNVPLYYKGMKAADAKALAPHLARNPHMHAALIRAIAAGNDTFTKAAAYIARNEMWRFSENTLKHQHLTRFLWDCGLKRDGDYRKTDALLRRPDPRAQALAKKVSKHADAGSIYAAQSDLVKDLLAKKPSIKGALDLLHRAGNAGGDEGRIAVFKSLCTVDQGGDREFLLRWLALRVPFRSGRRNHYARALPFPHHDTNQNFLRYGRKSVQQAGKVLGPHFQGVLKQQMARGTISETTLGMWIRFVHPRDKGAIAFMNQMIKSPAWAKVNPDYLKLARDKQYFGSAVGVSRTSPQGLSRELMNLPDKASAGQSKQAVTAVLKRLQTASGLPGMYGLEKAAGHYAGYTDSINKIYIDHGPLQNWAGRRGYLYLAHRYLHSLLTAKDYKAIQPLVYVCWHIAAANGDRNLGLQMVHIAEAAFEAGDISTAASVARIGVRFNSPHSRHGHEREHRIRLQRLYAKVSQAMGVADIPVQPNEPGYKIFKSQAEYVQDNRDTAWGLYDENADQMQPVLEKLRHDYCFWILAKNVESGSISRVEELVKMLTIWDRRGNANFTPQQQAELKLAYADVAYQKKSYGTARAWYRKVADNRDYRGTDQQYRAALGSVEVDREEKNYSGALEELDKLILVKDKELRMKVHFAKARIFYDQTKYKEANTEIDAVLRHDPKHADARLLQSKVFVKKRDLVPASKIRLGIKRSQEAISPGERVEVDLHDPSLNVSGAGVAIQVEVRAASGDRETMILRSIGDSNTEYRAEVVTALGTPRPGDKVLQVLGRDTITYGFSKEFRDKMKDLPPDPEEKIEVASDFYLAISAGDFPPREGERRLTIDELGLSTAEKALGLGRVRPGNPVYIRIIDADQSKTKERDEVAVEIKATSGDVIKRFILKETGPFSGEFEGQVPTAAGQAVAYAYSKEPGRDPNMAISPRTDYPGWEAQTSAESKEKFFTIDLNDSVKLKNLKIVSPAGKKLTRFIVQSSLNGNAWTSHGSFPSNVITPWDGRPQFATVSNGGNQGEYISVPGLSPQSNGLPEEWAGAISLGLSSARVNSASGIAKNLKGLKIPDLPHDRPQLVRFRALFYQSEIGMRTFRLSGFRQMKGHTVFLIDGKPSNGEDPFTIDREFMPGLHEIQVWNQDHGKYYRGMKMELQSGPSAEELTSCPDSMFDPTSFPKPIQNMLPGSAAVRDAGDGTYEIIFGKNTQAQLVRILIGGHAGDAPAINRITLTDTVGKQHLPVKADYKSLRENQQLEVLPGDQLVVKYVDDLAYTESRTQQEKRLVVAFNTAKISASFINYRESRDGSRGLFFEDIRRFRMDDNVAFIINDPDMDISKKRDSVPFRVRTSDGNTKIFKAYETAAHSGIFLGKVFPITGTPDREAEIQMTEGGTLTAIYRDIENLDPGIPTDRSITVEHAKYATPKFSAFTAVTNALPMKPVAPAPKKKAPERSSAFTRAKPEVVSPRIGFSSRLLSKEELAKTRPLAIYNGAARFVVIAPHLALAESSKITAYVQTEEGRKAAAAARKKARAEGKKLPPPSNMPFDVTIPGTLKLTSSVGGGGGGGSLPAGYEGAAGTTTAPRKRKRSAAPKTRRTPLDEGRFTFGVKLALGPVPTRSFATKAAEELPSDVIPTALNVSPGDKVYVGYAYLDKQGKPHWHTATFDLTGDILLDVMNKDYNEPLTTRFVGEKIFVRVIAPELDTTDGRDEVTVQVKAASGAFSPFVMRETFEHTGVFKGSFKLTYANVDNMGRVDPNKFFIDGLPVRYGDTVSVFREQALPKEFKVKINNGANGAVEPFSKRYADSATAIKTNFTLAECWFELAKMHRVMGKEKTGDTKKLTSLSRREMKHAKKLLEEALATHRDPEQQAHAEYLLGNLAQEYADISVDKEIKDRGYHDALSRFAKIPVDYPKSLFASKAQYKKALVYEKMKQMDIAVEEYVKLAYKYPEDELIPMAMSRIGGQFQADGIVKKKKSDALLAEKPEDPSAQETAAELLDDANRNFSRAATIYTELQKRYPKHPLAGLAGLRAGQNYMRIGDYRQGLKVLEQVYENEEYDGPDVRAQALYWAGIANEKLAALSERGEYRKTAFDLYNRTRFEFSASKWAKHARGRLASKDFEKLVAADERARAMALEAMKKR